ncbi:MAG TPA: Uma2 family endonuclease [Bryobacteraceae bacterium]|jgi:Uma2 family endonuclease|nr:Uma2 family endonuclease [Bryobacteraceae bacterium]
MAALPDLITVEQFRELPDDGEHCYELHHGEVVAMTRPKPGHWLIQRRVMRLLEPKVSTFGVVWVELPFRTVGQFDLRVADIGVVAHARWNAIDPEFDLEGAPDLVIEVISASNRRRDLRETVSLCLATGAIECWLLDRKKKTVSVIRRDGTTTVYGPGDEIPLTAFGSDSLAVSAIFE